MRGKFGRFGILDLTAENEEEAKFLLHWYKNQRDIVVWPGSYTYDNNTIHVTFHNWKTPKNIRPENLENSEL